MSTRWSSDLGLRREGIRTSSDNPGDTVRNTSSVRSPVLHTVYHIPGRKRGQVRASLPRSYRAPALDGVEPEAKSQLAELPAAAPDLDLRANYSRYWS